MFRTHNTQQNKQHNIDKQYIEPEIDLKTSFCIHAKDEPI